MAPSRKSSTSSNSSDVAESECLDLVVRKVYKYQPVSLSILWGHLSFLRINLKNFIGKDNADLRRFLKGYPDIFKINEHGMVSLLKHPKELGLTNHRWPFYFNDFPTNIEHGEGKITCLFSAYGFIKAQSPFVTSVYFPSSCCKKVAFQDFCVGQEVVFSAMKGEDGNSAEYRATSISPSSYGEDSDQSEIKRENKNRLFQERCKKPFFKPSSPSDNEAKDMKRHESIIKCWGKIQYVNSTYGFIEKENKDRVFFHMNAIQGMMEHSDPMLHLKKNDEVWFIAERSKKQTGLVLWQATKVWISQDATETADSDVEISACTKNENMEPVESDLYKDSTHQSQQIKNSDSRNNLKNCHGKIYPNSDKTAEIKFGKSSVIADDCKFYINGEERAEIMREFNEKDDVMFDAVKLRCDGNDFYWKAVLVWVGEKPDVYESVEPSNCSSKELNDVSNVIREKTESKVNYHSSLNIDIDEKVHTKKFTHYDNWGDSPYLDDSIEETVKTEELLSTKVALGVINETKKKENSISFKEIPQNPIGYCDTKIIKSPLDTLISSGEKQTESSDSCSYLSSKKKLTPLVDKQNYIKKEQKYTSSSSTIKVSEDLSNKESFCKSPGVFLYRSLKGKITKVYRHMIKINCDSLHKPSVALHLNDMYHNGKCLEEECIDPKSVLFEDDLIFLNCFEIIDDNGALWQKVTLAWKGEKPKSFPKDIEPKDFIELESLKVSFPVVSWKDYLRVKEEMNVKRDNTKLVNIENHSVMGKEKRFLSVVGKDTGQDSKDEERKVVNEDDSEYEDAEDFVVKENFDSLTNQGAPDSLVFQFTNIINSVNKLRRHFASFSTLQEFDDLVSKIETAIETVIPNGSPSYNDVPPCDMIDSYCQTVDNHSTQRRLPVSSSSTQTVVTGSIISKDIFTSN